MLSRAPGARGVDVAVDEISEIGKSASNCRPGSRKFESHPLRQCGFRLAQAPCCARDQVQDQAADCAEQIRAALLAVIVGLSPVRYFERAGRCGPPGEAAGWGCWGDRAVHLMPAGQVVYHGVPPPNPGRIIALST
jgi:hypothetical protein